MTNHQPSSGRFRRALGPRANVTVPDLSPGLLQITAADRRRAAVAAHSSIDMGKDTTMHGWTSKPLAKSATALLMLAALGCGFGKNTQTPQSNDRPTQPTTTAPRRDSPSPATAPKTDARFTVTRRGLTGVDPSNMKVSCSNIDYPVILKDASAPFHWKIRKDSRLRDVFTVPAEGDLTPGQQTIVRVKGNYDGRPGDELIVQIWSEESTQSAGIQMYCR
ncbi:hypothetical protein Rhe02_73050 [Rhizocola hellebori]|uniref:Uncharacterized protein n=1 Tax=Rhizocola hellebori TaxID=1392758 RepID=A0A8J3VKN6_9ACTN|nr:hypothetical protein Rhe02_73050 [Rhizocola hellebori]